MTLSRSAMAASCRLSAFGAAVVANLLKDAREVDSRDGPWCRLGAVLPHVAAIAVACGATIHLGPDGRVTFDMTSADLVAIDAAADAVIEDILPSLSPCRGPACGALSAGCRQMRPA